MENNNPESNEQIVDAPKEKQKAIVEYVLLLILGFLLGWSLKDSASRNITIGFEDYKIANARQEYDFKQMEKDLAAKQESQQQQESQEDVPVSGEGE